MKNLYKPGLKTELEIKQFIGNCSSLKIDYPVS
jgi:hypothetical protein